ncbi:MAG: PIN domain-containing protein [Acidobacteria bacterium]|nr:PIN domain-containing protein [Acidobacteriota bacterium]
MILVDTSVWVDHFRRSSRHLSILLDAETVYTHPFVLGELACGNIKNRKEIISLLRALPAVHKASDDEILYFIEQYRLGGSGIGLIDAHLLASCFISKCSLYTSDKRLQGVAEDLNVAYSRAD